MGNILSLEKGARHNFIEGWDQFTEDGVRSVVDLFETGAAKAKDPVYVVACGECGGHQEATVRQVVNDIKRKGFHKPFGHCRPCSARYLRNQQVTKATRPLTAKLGNTEAGKALSQVSVSEDHEALQG